MAKMELRKPIAMLVEEKNKIDQKFNDVVERYTVSQTALQTLRSEQYSYREAKEHLQNTNSNKAARKVFDDQIAKAQLGIDEALKKLDLIEKDRVVIDSQRKAIEKSIKELQNS